MSDPVSLERKSEGTRDDPIKAAHERFRDAAERRGAHAGDRVAPWEV